ncbi:class A beta-lactamase [Pseudomonas stutzeri]|uniref:class A beta-lactamase n=1 Tax=Stutzerimonas stutzeri TaxID=316 RepID=UPI00210B320D|nr:class A beta-lactamase [Stutzerimonas stutzeri]MCQ4288425.1 class A beta-lactamase [Stutzerimonas stutzeri]
MSLTRRRFISAAASLAAGSVCASMLSGGGTNDASENVFIGKAKELEARLGARIGAVVRSSDAEMHWAYRADERFPMCSTFKLLASGSLLTHVDAGRDQLDRIVRFEIADVVDYSPVTKSQAGGDGMTLAQLCKAALTHSDNTAGNLILEQLGGPGGVTEFARSLGDTKTRLDRWETELNAATPGDPRDTTTPAAMAHCVDVMMFGDALSASSQRQLNDWLIANKTGDAKLRAGIPASWRIGDKTGGGDHGTMNDVAVIWPPQQHPLIVSIYMTDTVASFDDRNAAFAELGRTIYELLVE